MAASLQTQDPNKLVLAIVQDEDAGTLRDALIERAFPHTRLSSVGGFLHRGNATLLIGVHATRLPGLFEVIRSHCQTRLGYFVPTFPMDVAEPLTPEPIEVEIGGALILILDVERFAYL